MSMSARIQGEFSPLTVNDVHSRLNATEVAGVVRPESLESVTAAVAHARAADLPLAVAGGRHAMGGQQFCDGGLLLDTTALDAVLDFDEAAGTIAASSTKQIASRSALPAGSSATSKRGRDDAG